MNILRHFHGTLAAVRVACAILLACAGSAAAQAPVQATARGPSVWADSARREIAAAYPAGDIERIARARALVERALTRWPDDAWLLHYLGFALYREATLRQNAAGEADIDGLLERAQDALERSAEARPVPETQALLATVLGQRIGSNPIRGITLGPRSNQWMDRAVESGPENPRVWLLRGIGAIFKPRMFGGGLDKAEADLRRAIELFEADAPAPPAPAWGRGEAWLWLGQVLQRGERIDDARAAYRKALEYEPENVWVRETLLPSVNG